MKKKIVYEVILNEYSVSIQLISGCLTARLLKMGNSF